MDAREEKIAALILQGATEGERTAARGALARLRQAQVQHNAELERSVGFGWNPARMEAEASEHAATMDRLDAEAESLGSYE